MYNTGIRVFMHDLDARNIELGSNSILVSAIIPACYVALRNSGVLLLSFVEYYIKEN